MTLPTLEVKIGRPKFDFWNRRFLFEIEMSGVVREIEISFGDIEVKDD